MFFQRCLVAAAICIGLFAAGPTSALTFSAEPLDSSKTIILVTGVFEPSEDLSGFVSLAKNLGGNHGIVVFNSPGGHPSKAIEMGRLIRTLGLSTFQFRNMECSSACALAFIGGVARGAETGSIGVHKSFFSENTGISVEDAVSYVQHQTAETISYMSEMGIDPALLQLSLRYEKDDMRYLSKSEMAQYRVTNVDMNTPSSATQAGATLPVIGTETKAVPDHRIADGDPRFQIPLAKSGALRVPKGKEQLRRAEDQKSQKLLALSNGEKVEILAVGERWYYVKAKGMDGYLHHNWVKVDQFVNQPFENRYIQIKSFDNYSDAEAYVRHSSLPVTAYLAANKWFAVALTRTIPLKRASEFAKDLKARKLIPDDAFVTVGNTYVKSVCCSN